MQSMVKARAASLGPTLSACCRRLFRHSTEMIDLGVRPFYDVLVALLWSSTLLYLTRDSME